MRVAGAAPSSPSHEGVFHELRAGAREALRANGDAGCALNAPGGRGGRAAPPPSQPVKVALGAAQDGKDLQTENVVAFGAETHAAAAAVQRSFRRNKAQYARGAAHGRAARAGGAAKGGEPRAVAPVGALTGHAAAAMAKINGLLDDARALRGDAPGAPGAPGARGARPPEAMRPHQVDVRVVGHMGRAGTPLPGAPKPSPVVWSPSHALSPQLQRQKSAIEAERQQIVRARMAEEEAAQRRREADEARDAQRAAERAAKKEKMLRGY